ncbi:post-GPI attachment to proteins factor 6 isoform X2 [Anthonomus grandis grandis]|uniref:post-GPI attachment to proteins factor 6 isoform X2 n=1 Tax=Anthonomus grandis grandis TaxID=2921223 RepID=UPI0021666454|nr:post-GPI attachment to proteins factor 6 isoform X2 [Anthonomus grandis grandis]
MWCIHVSKVFSIFCVHLFICVLKDLCFSGLTQSCRAYVDATVYTVRIESITISDNELIEVISNTNQSRYFKYFVPDGVDHTIIYIENMKLSSKIREVTLRVQAGRPPSKHSYIFKQNLDIKRSTYQTAFKTDPGVWHYILFTFYLNSADTDVSQLKFRLKLFSNKLPASESFVSQSMANITLYNMSVIYKHYQSNRITDIQPYKEFTLAREEMAESFGFTYKLQAEMTTNMFVPINVTGEEFTALKFILHRGTDVGGTLQYIIAFKPRVSRNNGFIHLTKEPEHHVVIGCIQRNTIAVPTWPNTCVSNQESTLAPLILNSTVTNNTVLIPYPENGVWYASFKLFCGKCEPCVCPDSCDREFENCVIDCELNGKNDEYDGCFKNCSSAVIGSSECASCDCDGPCKKKNSTDACKSAVVFDISSRPCYFGECGKHGTCGLFIAEGVAYSSCLCHDSYRGYDCSDGTLATPYYMVVIEFVLLICTSIPFIVVAYIAYRRNYYIEAISYSCVFLASSFYHACDAGENIISYCLFPLAALQFADFFSALLSIWVTLLAMANLSPLYLSILQMVGSIVIAFSVTLNRYALWIFAIPSTVGVVTILVSWYFKFRHYRINFVDKQYLYIMLPTGLTIASLGLIIFALLQTQNNYKYLHSMWHCMMALSVVVLLPTKKTFHKVIENGNPLHTSNLIDANEVRVEVPIRGGAAGGGDLSAG